LTKDPSAAADFKTIDRCALRLDKLRIAEGIKFSIAQHQIPEGIKFAQQSNSLLDFKMLRH
jgi:hypothetical protein